MDLSIIIPAYNVETYIGTCLESLILQGFEKEEYEILCINDRSTDKSADKIKEFQNKYPEIRLIEQNNSGVSSARNKGSEEAKGKWVFFCDADDFLEVNSLKKIIETMVEKKVKSASFRYDMVEENATVNFENKNFSGGEYRTGIKKPFYSGNIWRFIFDRELIINNGIKFILI